MAFHGRSSPGSVSGIVSICSRLRRSLFRSSEGLTAFGVLSLSIFPGVVFDPSGMYAGACLVPVSILPALRSVFRRGTLSAGIGSGYRILYQSEALKR